VSTPSTAEETGPDDESHRLRVLLVAQRFAPSTGGVETHVLELARRLPRHGIEVSVLTADESGDLPAEEVIDGVPVRRVRGRPKGRDWLIAPGLPGAIRAVDADIVHVHSYQTFVPPVALATSLASRRKTLLTFHSGGHSSGWRSAIRPLQTLALSPLLRHADALIGVSRFEAELFARRLRLPTRRVQVIPNGSDLPSPSAGVQTVPGLIVSTGRLETYKGHGPVIEAVARLAAQDPAIRLKILGSGPDEASLRARAERLGIADRVTIESIPGTQRQRYVDQIAAAECVVILSAYEAHSIGAWETARLGRPLVVTQSTGLAELVESGHAVGVAPGASPSVVAAAIRDAIAAGPRTGVVLPTWDDVAARTAALYRELMQRNAPGD
jgi:glycosyltransferase involved in cell wall biosynthesis